MVAAKKSWPRVMAAAALASSCLAAAHDAAAEEQRTTGAEPSAIGDGGVTIRSGPQKDVVMEPPAALVRFNVPGLAHREHAWDVAAHASAGNDIRFQRAFFLSAHMRF
jgi:hypothetical protein